MNNAAIGVLASGVTPRANNGALSLDQLGEHMQLNPESEADGQSRTGVEVALKRQTGFEGSEWE